MADQNKSENNTGLYVSELGSHPIKSTQMTDYGANWPLMICLSVDAIDHIQEHSLVWNICCDRLFFLFFFNDLHRNFLIFLKFHCGSHCTLLMGSSNIKQNIFFCKTSKWFNSWLGSRPVRQLLSPVLAFLPLLFYESNLNTYLRRGLWLNGIT